MWICWSRVVRFASVAGCNTFVGFAGCSPKGMFAEVEELAGFALVCAAFTGVAVAVMEESVPLKRLCMAASKVVP